MHNLKNLKHIFAIWIITILLIVGVMRLFGADFLVPITQFFVYRDAPLQNFIYRHEWQPSTDQIAIIKIDDNSLNELQATSNQKVITIPKKTYAELIEKLKSVGVKGIAIDIVFANKDEGEGALAEVLSANKNVVISLAYNEGDFQCIQDADTLYQTCSGVPRSVYSGAQWGVINIDKYGYSRGSVYDITAFPYAQWKSQPMLDTLALALYKNSGNTLSYELPERVLNPYFGGPGAYPTISFSDVLTMSKRDMVATFAGKYVFIGESGTLIHDEIVSPVSGTMMPGVETHAHLLDGLLQERVPTEVDITTIVIMTIVLTMIFVFLYFFLPQSISPILAVGIFFFFIWFGRYMYGSHDQVYTILPLMLAGSIFSFPITFIYRFFIVDREKRKMQKDFGHYVDPRVVAEISESGNEIELGGERRPMTVMFSDIAGFTTISEKLTPNDLFFLMTSYLSNMTDILIEQGGTLDKYIGDAVMGFFGAPLSVSDHALRACRTALLMRERLPEFNAGITKHGIDAIDFRVGIATGDDVMVGNIGSKERFNYTVLGDTVNLASRLEGTGKEYGVHIIIAHPTREAIGDAYIVRELDTIAVKGKSEGVRIYELIGTREQATNLYAYEVYEKALALYRAAQYRDAGIMWEKQKDIDPPSAVMMQRCLELLRMGTTLENGVYHMTHK